MNTNSYSTLPSPTDQIESLTREVADLKQKVAFLTGLVLPNQPVHAPFAAAKLRGAAYMRAEFESPDSLTLAAASTYAGRSDRLINLERNKGWLYALIMEGNTRGYRYPKWQFDVPASRLRAVLGVLTAGSLSCWSVHSFLTRAHFDLDHLSPSEALSDSNFPLHRVIDLARRHASQQQGAA